MQAAWAFHYESIGVELDLHLGSARVRAGSRGGMTALVISSPDFERVVVAVFAAEATNHGCGV